MNHRMWIGIWLVWSLSVGMLAAAEPAGVNLSQLQGWDIVVAEDAIASEKFAAEELQKHIELATGTKLPITGGSERADRHFFVGPGKSMEASPAGFSVDGLGPEDLRIVVRGSEVAIAGGRPRGTLYGVYTFLEDYLGVRFLTADHTYVPRVKPDQVVPALDRSYHPPLEMRWAYYGEVNRNPALAARLRVNTVGDDPKLGGRTGQRLISHSFAGQIPSSKYGQEHPEYFCFRDGKRIAPAKNDSFDNEPCLTNPDVLKIVTKAALDEIAAHPETANVSVSQNDNDKNCLCPKCAAIDQREGTPMGSLLEFVNAVADAVAEKYPNVKVGTLSYWYTRKPPKTIKPRPNVQIQLCSIECCMIHPIDDPNCPKNVAFCQDMAHWGKICDQIYIWNYNTNFRNYVLPCPNLRVIEPNIRYFLANHAKGVFMQAAGNANGAELSELRAYVISRLLWDPSRSGQEAIDEFLELHYGPAAPPIRRYIKHIHDRAEASGRHQNCFGQLADYGLDQSDAELGLEAFAEALKLADSDEVRSRVERASICVYRAALEPIWYRDSGPLEPAVAEKLRPAAKRFLELCDKFQVDRAQEWGEEIPGTRSRLKKIFGVGETESF